MRLKTGIHLAGCVAKGADKGCITWHWGMRSNDFQFNTTDMGNR